MSSAFRPAAKNINSTSPGIKPFINGQSLVSSGLQALDSICGGGLLLHTLNVIEGPLMAQYGMDILSYFIAQGIIHEQKTYVCGPSDLSLPFELSSSAATKTEPEQQALNIAWQYGKYKTNTKRSSRFCHSFDLSRAMQLSFLEKCPVVEIPSTKDYMSILAQVKATTQGQIQRLALYDLPIPTTDSEKRDFLVFIQHLKRFLRDHSIVCMLLIQQELMPITVRRQLEHFSDSLFQLNCFAELNTIVPIELQEFVGVFVVQKVPRLHSLACHTLSATTYGISRSRRKLAIEHLHLPPEQTRSATLDF